MSAKILVLYHSQSGNTEKLAKMIATEVGGAVVSITDEVDLSAAEVVFVGTPNIAASASPQMKEFLGSIDLSGKMVVPFCTHGMGGLQNVADDIASLCPNSTILQSFAIKGEEVASAPEKLKAWLAEIKIA